MKLKELATIARGIDIDRKVLIKEMRPAGSYYQYIQPEDFEIGSAKFVSARELRKIAGLSKRDLLNYGDYLIFKKDNKFSLYRYDNSSGQTLPSNDFFVIKTEINIVKDFLSVEKNKKYFYHELYAREEKTGGKLTAWDIGDIEINTENIKELEESNIAEQLGIRNPIDISETPFRITSKPLPIDKLLKRINYKELLLDTEFQRRPGLWDIETKSRLLESMVIRLPIPAFYFDGSNDNEWLIIDGLQRLSAVNDFVAGKFTLEGLDYLPELTGKTFFELPRAFQRNIEEYEIFAYIIEKGTPKSVTYKIFKSINTSALKLEPQEIRHAINPGPPAEFLKEIADSPWFQKAVPISDRLRDRMWDREIALRFIAFQQKKYFEFKLGIVNFLDEAMTEIYDIPAHKRNFYKQDLADCLKILTEVLGEKTFSRAMFDESRVYNHNNIIFELLTYMISILPTEARAKILSNKSHFASAIRTHFANQPAKFWDGEYAYTIEGVTKRFEGIEKFIKVALT